MAVEIEHFPQIRNSDKCAYAADVPDRIIHEVLIPEAENIGGVHFARRDGGGGLPSPDARGWVVFAMRYRGGDIASVSDGYDELSPGYQTPDVLDVLQMVRGFLDQNAATGGDSLTPKSSQHAPRWHGPQESL
jgi:hypothetical protein